MDCDALKDLLPLYALGTLDGAEKEEVRRHLQTGCPRCQGILAEYQAILSLLPLSLPPVAPPPAVRDRLLKQVAKSSHPAETAAAGMKISPAPPSTAIPSRTMRWVMPALLGGALAAGITALVFSPILTSQKTSIENLTSRLERKTYEVQQLQGTVRDAQELNHFVESPAIQIVNLQGTDQQPAAKARLFWDPASRALKFYAADLKNLPVGKAFELWFVNAEQKKIPAGVFTSDDHGAGALAATLSSDPGRIVAVAVTIEAAGGVPAPTNGNYQFLKALD